MKLSRFSTFCFAAGLSAACSFAITPTIGVASTAGTFVVNSAVVEGNANLFDGSQIRTVDASSQIFLENGPAVTLGTNSTATLYKDRLLLQQGLTRVGRMKGYSIQAGTYRIEGSEPGSQAVVRLNEKTVEVAALSGSLNVFNEQGALLTRIGAGTASAFQASPSGGQSGASSSNNNSKKRLIKLSLVLGGMLAGLGVAVDAILQPTSP